MAVLPVKSFRFVESFYGTVAIYNLAVLPLNKVLFPQTARRERVSPLENIEAITATNKLTQHFRLVLVWEIVQARNKMIRFLSAFQLNKFLIAFIFFD